MNDPTPIPRDDSPAVYLAELRVENIGCFGPVQTLDLTTDDGRPARWTLVLGDNGVGKTTLMQVAACFAPEARSGVEAPKGRKWINEDRLAPMARHPRIVARVAAKLFACEPLSAGAGIVAAKTIGFDVSRHDHGHVIAGFKAVPKQLEALACFAYGAGRRPGVEPSLSQTDDESGTETLFDDAADLINPVEWLLQTDYAAAKAETVKARDFWNQRLHQVRQTLIELLPDVTRIQITGPGESHGKSRPTALFQTPYGEVPFERMGLGYRTMVAWIVDLAARMFRRWPDSPSPIAEPAVVLVDEIDLHLHPSWQRRLLGWLSERFVNTQFIATAHSPLVVQAAADANIAVLRRDGDHAVIDQSRQSVTGWRVDQILTSDLFGLPSARPPEYDALLEERVQLLSKPRLDEADQRRIDTLARQMDALPSGETAEDIEARELIRRAAEAIASGG